jgi:DNA-binding transcriptional ArsR family regulator
MSSLARMAEIAALVGDPARANILSALMDGRALTAKELAYAARVAPSTASAHLAALTEAGLLTCKQQGRHRYHRLSSALVGSMLESILAVAAQTGPPVRRDTWRGGEALRTARSCYDHLAGKLAVAIADRLEERGHVVLTPDGGEVTDTGSAFLAEFGADPIRAGSARRMYCRLCLDWSEHRPHIGGRIGAAIATRCFELGWITRLRDTRAVTITDTGRAGFANRFGVTV